MNTQLPLDKRIDNVLSAHKQTREELQSILIDIAIKCGNESHDIRYAEYLVDKLTNKEGEADGLRGEAIVKWLNDYASVKIEYSIKDKKHIVSFRKDITDEEAVQRLNAGKAKQWWIIAKPKKLTEYSTDDAVNTLLSIASKKGKEKAKLEAAGNTEAADLIHLDTELTRAIAAIKSNAYLRQMVLEQAYGKKDEQQQSDAA